MDSCDKMRETLSRLLDGDLSPAEEREARAHLAACPRCKRSYDALRAFSEALRSEELEPPARPRENVMAQLRREALRKRNQRLVRLIASVAAVAALAFGLGLTLPRLTQGQELAAAVLPAEAARGEAVEAETEALPPVMAARSGEANAALFSAEETPEPSPSPTPEPTPEPTPTPRPLLDAALTAEGIDASFFEPCAEPGTLLRDVAYTTQDYIWKEEGARDKLMQVYLPYGYDENGRYDVLFLIHTRQLNERFWLEQEHSYRRPDGSVGVGSTVTLLDNMIARGLCRPLIVVSLNGYLDEGMAYLHISDQVYPQFREEFRRDILPFVASRFATWAEDGSPEALRAARRHVGLFGASFGAYEIVLSVLEPNLDLASRFALTGGGAVTREMLEPQWSMYGTRGEPIDLLYFAEGEYDDRGPIENSYAALGTWSEVFKQEENLYLTLLRGVGHEEPEWMTALYNTLQLMFR